MMDLPDFDIALHLLLLTLQAFRGSPRFWHRPPQRHECAGSAPFQHGCIHRTTEKRRDSPHDTLEEPIHSSLASNQ